METGMTREEHIAQSKKRALEYLDRGEFANAVASMISDMQDIETVNPILMSVGALAVNNHDVAAIHRFIEGFR
jgi:hypothetical protein